MKLPLKTKQAMNLKVPLKKAAVENPAITSLVNNLTPGTVIVHHHQSIKQSKNYNSADVGYSLSVVVPDSDAAIVAAVERLERLVEEPLAAKFREQAKVLDSLS